MDGLNVRHIVRPARLLIVKWSKNASCYFTYAEEIGCGESNYSIAWDELIKIEGAIDEPMGLWIPENLRPENTGEYAHGIEVPIDYAGEIPEGFDVVKLEPCEYLLFQCEPFEDDKLSESIGSCLEYIEDFNLEEMGNRFIDDAPRI